MHEKTITLEPGGSNLPTEQAAREIREALGCAEVGVQNLGSEFQHLGSLPAKVAPDYFLIDLTQGLNATGYLIADTVIKFSGATAGQGGLITLGVHGDFPGVSFDVKLQADDGVAALHTLNGHSVLSGSMSAFNDIVQPGEYNFGTISWFYDGYRYLIYVSNVEAYSNPIQFQV